MLTLPPDTLEKRDARKLSRQELQERRTQVIALFVEGVPVMQIVQRCGLSWTAVNAAIQRYKAGGSDALLPDSRGRKEGTGRLLTEAQERTVCQYISRRRPWFYGLKDTLWSADTVSQLIEKKLDIRLSERSVANYLKRWGLMKDAVKKKPLDRCSTKVKAWLQTHYEDILQKVQQENAEIYWISSPTKIKAKIFNVIKYSRKENEEIDNNTKSRSVVSVINSRGRVYWVVLNGSFTPERQINLMKNISKSTDKRVYLIRCNEKVMANSNCYHWVRDTENIKNLELLPKLNFN